jgi:hypothetical protein
MAQEIREAKSEKDAPREQQLESMANQESAELVGTSQEWKQYREEFGSLTNEAIRREIIPNYDFLGRLFRYLDHAGTLSVDAQGALWLDISEGGKPAKLGLSRSNIFASGTDSQWAYALTLARANHYLKSPKHSREIMPDFKNDWALLEAARINSSTSAAANNTLLSGDTRATPMSFAPVQ